MLRVLPCKFNTTNEWLSLYAIVKIGGKEVMVKISFLSKQKSLKGKNNNNEIVINLRKQSIYNI